MIQSELYAVEVNGVIDYAVRPAGKRSAIIETDVHHSRGVAQPGSAPALGAGGPRFKSARPDQHISNRAHKRSPSLRCFCADAGDYCFRLYGASPERLKVNGYENRSHPRISRPFRPHACGMRNADKKHKPK